MVAGETVCWERGEGYNEEKEGNILALVCVDMF